MIELFYPKTKEVEYCVCPYCRQEIINENYETLKEAFEYHIKHYCSADPNKKMCGSCVNHKTGSKCKIGYSTTETIEICCNLKRCPYWSCLKSLTKYLHDTADEKES